MKTTQILSVMLTVIFVIVRFGLLTIAVIRVRPQRQGTKRVGFQRGLTGQSYETYPRVNPKV